MLSSKGNPSGLGDLSGYKLHKAHLTFDTKERVLNPLNCPMQEARV